MKIGVVGIGTVGSAVADGLESFGHEVKRFDPNKGYNDHFTAEIIFICVNDNGDTKNVTGAVRDWSAAADVIAIKTTVPPGTTDRLIEQYGEHIIYCPEFLCDKTAHDDFLNPDKIVFGTSVLGKAVNKLWIAYEPMGLHVLMMHPVEAEILKLALNTFYAVKVVFANEVADLCEKYGCQYEAVREGMELDRFIHANHLDVDHNSYRGFGGKCLQKDTAMFVRAGVCKSHTPRIAREAMRLNGVRRYGDV